MIVPMYLYFSLVNSLNFTTLKSAEIHGSLIHDCIFSEYISSIDFNYYFFIFIQDLKLR